MTVPEPIDPDLGSGADAAAPAQRGPATIVVAVAAGGVLGATARYQAGRWWPQPGEAFPWTTLLVNVVGCLAIGAVMTVLLAGLGDRYPLARPFLVTGLLGGFTTFSTYAVDLQRLATNGRWVLASSYLLATLAAALAAVVLGQLVVQARRGHRA